MDTEEFWIWSQWKAGAPLDKLAEHHDKSRADILRTIGRVAAKIDRIQGSVNREAWWEEKNAEIVHKRKMVALDNVLKQMDC